MHVEVCVAVQMLRVSEENNQQVLPVSVQTIKNCSENAFYYIIPEFELKTHTGCRIVIQIWIYESRIKKWKCSADISNILHNTHCPKFNQ